MQLVETQIRYNVVKAQLQKEIQSEENMLVFSFITIKNLNNELNAVKVMLKMIMSCDTST